MSDEIPGESRVRPVAVDNGAPILSFDGFASVGHRGGMFTISLTLGIPTVMSDGTVPPIHHVVAHLYGDASALQKLRQAVDNCLMLGVETQGQAN